MQVKEEPGRAGTTTGQWRRRGGVLIDSDERGERTLEVASAATGALGVRTQRSEFEWALRLRVERALLVAGFITVGCCCSRYGHAGICVACRSAAAEADARAASGHCRVQRLPAMAPNTFSTSDIR
jgi:hypothetical protein